MEHLDPLHPALPQPGAPVPPPERLVIRGAEEHTLKSVDLELPKNALIVFTGVSGSGKSSLAFDTLYAEGRRRYMESLSVHARTFLGQLEKPRVQTLKGLSPTIAIEQGLAPQNPRSTVGTITELHDHLRLLFARVGAQHCHRCGHRIERLSAQEMVGVVKGFPLGTRFSILAPLHTPASGSLAPMLLEAGRRGFVRVRLDGAVHLIEDLPGIDPKIPHTLELVIDRLVMKEGLERRLTDSIETALKFGEGALGLLMEDGRVRTLTERLRCPGCSTEVPELTPQLFSFNSPRGMCRTCHGLGTTMEPDPGRMVPDPSLTLEQGAVKTWATAFERQEGVTYATIAAGLKALNIPVDVPFRSLPPPQQQQVLYASGDLVLEVEWDGNDGKRRMPQHFEGAITTLRRRMLETRSEEMRRAYMEYLSQAECTDCQGTRLCPEARAVRVAGQSLDALQRLTITEVSAFFDGLCLKGVQARIAAELIREVQTRLHFLLEVGLPYLTLERKAPTLSGGEAQRIRLAAALGSDLCGVLYVLDEPSVGLHPRDHARLLVTLKRLRDAGNTVLVVEHDPETIAAADYLVDFGPGAGPHGGRVLYSGPPQGIAEVAESLTGQYLSGVRRLERGGPPRPPARKQLSLLGITAQNLQGLDVTIPLERLVAITGVSGAGKSTLLHEALYPALARRLHSSSVPLAPHRELRGLEHLTRVILVDQAPIGRSPRSIPATYVKLFDPLRKLFASLPEARARGFTEQRFSFNARGGRCEACEGEGQRRIDMAFLSEVWVPCEVCRGRRFNEATLEIQFKGLSIADLLDLPVETLYPLLKQQPAMGRILQTLNEVGLGYLTLGQSATTLSGGEAQRLKLARELARPDSGQTLYVLDEPTTGLHLEDVARLLRVLERLVDQGNSVVMIEHHMELLACADHILDLGPEGGSGGGRLVVAGTPEQVAGCEASHTGRFLRPHIQARAPLPS